MKKPPGFSLLHPDFRIMAHRGAGAARPENTLEACEHSWAASSWLIPEIDVSTTRDGVLVAFHDDKLGRVAKGSSFARRKLQEIAWKQARRIDVGAYLGPEFSKHYLPSVAGIFAKMKGRPKRCLFIDHKRASVPELAKLVRQFKVERQVIFCSQDMALIRAWNDLMPESKTLLWIWNSGPGSVEKGMEAARRRKFEGIDAFQLHLRCVSPRGFSPSTALLRRWVKELKDRGKVVQAFPSKGVYGGRCPQQALHALLDLGVGSFASDFPGDVLRALREH